MSAYDNIVGGKLKLKGKALDVKAAGMKKQKKIQKKQRISSELTTIAASSRVVASGYLEKEAEEKSERGGPSSKDANSGSNWNDHLTPAERRYMEQREKIDSHKLAKTSNKSHRDRIQDFNQYLANMSEHYDIPKVGPG
ncbi:hypothetical protein M569_02248 [Genlisea aurea]|uniref:Protein FAM32A-like n=1 Tax=Genlisea aurea TaxID=192259 RepID=S8D539_9LAMI|nr:hypothetical protein M569_02248 [Genlisea aurea]